MLMYWKVMIYDDLHSGGTVARMTHKTNTMCISPHVKQIEGKQRRQNVDR